MWETLALVLQILGVFMTVIAVIKGGAWVVRSCQEYGKAAKTVAPAAMKLFIRVDLLQVRMLGRIAIRVAKLVTKQAVLIAQAQEAKDKLVHAMVLAVLVGLVVPIVIPWLFVAIAKVIVMVQVAKVRAMATLVKGIPKIVAAQRALSAFQKSTRTGLTWY